MKTRSTFLIFAADELIKQEEETARQVFLHTVHRTRRVHDADDDSIRFFTRVFDESLIDQIISAEGKAFLLAMLVVRLRNNVRVVCQPLVVGWIF